MGFEIVEHTADAGFRAWGPDLASMFGEAGRALFAIMGAADGPALRAEAVAVEAPDLDGLLVDFLSELLFLFEARDVVPQAFAVDVDEDPWRVRGEVRGPGAERFEQHGPQVKAVTYHGLEVRRGVDVVEARVYVDV